MLFACQPLHCGSDIQPRFRLQGSVSGVRQLPFSGERFCQRMHSRADVRDTHFEIEPLNHQPSRFDIEMDQFRIGVLWLVYLPDAIHGVGCMQ